jgi:putative membrane protein (TIGR04086 family)
MANERERKAGKGFIMPVLRSALIACAFSVLLVAAFALVLQKQWLGTEAVPYINAGVKTLCAVIAALLAVRRAESRAMLRGALAGGLYALITFAVFSLIAGAFSPGKALLTDLAMCMLGGAVIGVIRNLRR